MTETDRFGAGAVHECDGRETVSIGRSQDCDIVLDDPSVAPAHLLVRELPDGTVRLEPSETVSLNGVACIAPRTLRSGDVMRVGDVTLRLQRVYGRTGLSRRSDLVATGAKLLLAAVIGMELIAVIWIPRRVRDASRWEAQIADEEVAILLDSLRRRHRSPRLEEPLARAAEVAIVRELDARARYLRVHRDRLGPRQRRRHFEEIRLLGRALGRIEQGGGVPELPPLDVEGAVREVLAAAAEEASADAEP